MRIFQIILKILVFPWLLVSCSSNMEQGREELNWDKDWVFHLGNVSIAAKKDFDDSDWRQLDLPHDWSIEGEYSQDNPAGIAGAFLPTGIGWYRKELEYQDDWKNKRVSILFDGVYMNSTVYINGEKLGTHPYGYIGFQYDLTDYLVEGKNVIAVKVDHSKAPSGRWYTGSGIYRHVRLLITSQEHFTRHGVLATPKVINGNDGTIAVKSSIINDGLSPKEIKFNYSIKDKNGEVVKKLEGEKFTLKSNSTENIEDTLQLEDIDLWSAETPENRYVLEAQITDDSGSLLDNYTTSIGFRTIEVSVEKGLFVNGKKTIIKGMCMHHDAGPVGTAVPEEVLRRRLKLLKEMGCNAIRTTHNPFAPAFYEMCDEMGFYVMDEAFDGWEVAKAKFDYGNYFEEWWQKDLQEFIERDMNHPSVVFWSIGNEVRGFTDARQHELVDFIKRIDDSRPITQGEGSKGTAIEIAGMNGHGEFKDAIEDFHNKHPEKPIIGTEITHTYQTRGVYRTHTSYRRRDFPAPWEKGQSFAPMKNKIYLIPDLSAKEVFPEFELPYQSSYDNSIVRMGIRDYWRVTKDKPYFLGAFRWTAFDYLGESFGWPARTAPFGILDLAGFPTDNYYLYQSIWSDKPMVHMLPHWTHPGKEGQTIPVVVYTNTASAELFLNEKSLGKKKLTGDELQLVWQVPYELGELKVIAHDSSGKEVSQVYRTAGKPVAIDASIDSKELQDGEVAHIEINIVDENGIEVPMANMELNFTVTGGGKLIGLENGDILDLTSSKAHHRKTFHGKLLAIIQAGKKNSDIDVEITGQGLKTTHIKLHHKS